MGFPGKSCHINATYSRINFLGAEMGAAGGGGGSSVSA